MESNLNYEIKQAENEIIKGDVIMLREKYKFINEITHGLGDEIVKNNGKVTIVKRNLFQRIGKSITNFFTKF